MNRRYCPLGNHLAMIERFRKKVNGALVRDCIECEEKRRLALATRHTSPAGDFAAYLSAPSGTHNYPDRAGPLLATAEFPGVDIDAIHFKLGRVR